MHQKLIIFHLPWSKLKIYLWYIQNSWMRFFISTWKKCRIFQNISWQIMFTRLEIYCEHLIVLQVCARIKKKKVHALQNLYPIVFILFFYSIKASWYLIHFMEYPLSMGFDIFIERATNFLLWLHLADCRRIFPRASKKKKIDWNWPNTLILKDFFRMHYRDVAFWFEMLFAEPYDDSFSGFVLQKKNSKWNQPRILLLIKKTLCIIVII